MTYFHFYSLCKQKAKISSQNECGKFATERGPCGIPRNAREIISLDWPLGQLEEVVGEMSVWATLLPNPDKWTKIKVFYILYVYVIL